MKFLKYSIYWVSLCIVSILCGGCSPEKDTPKTEADVIVDNSTTESPVIIDTLTAKYFPPHIMAGQEEFDWENLEYFPLPSYVKNPVPVPWSDKAKRWFSDDIRYDIKKSDGWILYSSTFSSQFAFGTLIFVLYNKYSGIIRVYYLCGSGTEHVKDYNICSNSIHTLGDHAQNSPLLNFSNQKIIDVNTNSTLGLTLEPQPISDSTWYAFEYELAFDKDIYNQSVNTFLLDFELSMIKKETLIINGKGLNDLNTKIRFADPIYISGDSYTGDVRLIINGKNDLNKMSTILSSSDLALLNEIADNQKFDNLLNGVMDYNSLGAIQWDANITITSVPDGVGFAGISYPISGADNSVMQGPGQFYTNALGVFYLNKKPIVTSTKLSDGDHPYQYVLIVPSVEYLFNPSVLEIADVININQEIVATENPEILTDYGRAKLYSGQKLTSNVPLHIQGVRVSFDVLPKDGGKKIHIAKLFQANSNN